MLRAPLFAAVVIGGTVVYRGGLSSRCSGFREGVHCVHDDSDRDKYSLTFVLVCNEQKLT